MTSKKKFAISFLCGALSSFVFIGCTDNKDDSQKQKLNIQHSDTSVNVIESSNKLETYLDTTEVNFNKYKLKLISIFINDSVSSNETNMFNPICLSQIICFSINDSMVYSAPQPVRYITQMNNQGKKILMMENVVNEIGFLEGKEGLLFSIEGYGGCNSCTEYRALYNDKGEIVYCRYSNQKTVYSKIGELQSVLKKYGIESSTYQSGDFTKAKVSLIL